MLSVGQPICVCLLPEGHQTLTWSKCRSMCACLALQTPEHVVPSARGHTHLAGSVRAARWLRQQQLYRQVPPDAGRRCTACIQYSQCWFHITSRKALTLRDRSAEIVAQLAAQAPGFWSHQVPTALPRPYAAHTPACSFGDSVACLCSRQQAGHIRAPHSHPAGHCRLSSIAGMKHGTEQLHVECISGSQTCRPAVPTWSPASYCNPARAVLLRCCAAPTPCSCQRG